jgi:hypothetical protein
MADVSDYERISRDADEFQQDLSSFIRDLCHAYLALSDRGSMSSCIGTLVKLRAALYQVLDEPIPQLTAKGTGIGKDSLKSTLASIITYAQRVDERFKEVDEDGIPDNISRWLATRGKELLKGLTHLVSDLLTENNLHKIVLKLNPPG